MTQPRLLARVEITNAQGFFDSANPRPTAGAGGLDSVRIAAEVTKSLESEPNTAEIRMWNLSTTTMDLITGTVRKRLEWSPEEKAELLALGLSTAPIEAVYDNFGMASVRLSWGYEGADPTTPFPPLSVGFIGASTSITVEDDGLDGVLVIKAEDAGQLLGAGRLSKSFGPRTNLVTIVAELVHALGLTVDTAKLDSAMQTALIRRGIPVSSLMTLGGFNAQSSPAADTLRSIFEGLDLRWSVQDGQFLLLDQGTVLSGYEPLLIAGPTLLGQPQRLEANQMRVPTWANAEARPGRQVLLDATNLSTQYRIDRVDHSFDTREGGESLPTLSELQTIAGVF